MAPIGTLWTVVPQNGLIPLAVAAYGGLEVHVPSDYRHFEDNKKPEFLSKFPHGKIPAFEGNDGFRLTETVAIARYFASLSPNSTLLGTSPTDAALIDQWLAFATFELGPSLQLANQLTRGVLQPFHRALQQRQIENVIRSLKTLNGHLQTRTFLVGERLTLADIAIASRVQGAFTTFADTAVRKEVPNVVRLFETVANHPALKPLFGETAYVEKALQFTPPAKK